MALAQYLIIITTILGLLGLAHSRAMQKDKSNGEKGCEATVAEGQTAAMTFFFGHDALAREDFFAHLRRSKDPTDAIVICDRNSPVKCKVKDARYKSEGLTNNSFTLLIHNITREFEDTYVFQTYAMDTHQRKLECILTVTVENNKCSAPKVTEGSTGTITFFISADIVSKQDFQARLTRADDPESDIMVCDRNSSTQCKLIDQSYMSKGIVNETITLQILNISPDFEDTYILLMYVRGPLTFLDACHLTVERRDSPTGSENNYRDNSGAWIGTMVFVIVLALAVVGSSVYIVHRMKKKYRNTSSHSSEKSDGAGELLLRSKHDNNSVDDSEENSPEGKRWYYGMIQREEEKSLFEYRRNGHGSFLIRQRITNPAHFTLAVKFEGDIQRFVIVPEQNGFRCIETDGHFNTLPQLVKFYSDNDIQVGDKVWGKLSKPVERELKAEWYFGDVTDTDEARLLGSGKKHETGLFLVRDGQSGLHDYILSVNVDGIVKRFPIIQQNNKFKLIDNGDTFQTLCELVDSYQKQGTATDDNLFKLRQPAKKGPIENWFVEHMSREDEKLLLKYRRNGPGSFLIRQRITNPAHFTLSVLFEGEIQRFTIIPEKNGLRCIETEKCFPTLPHLVDWYKKQDIKVDDKVWGKLSKPFEKELEAEWYFGHITDKDETKLLKSGQEEKKGTFLVKDGTRGLHDYVLSVNHNGTVLHFPIVQRDNVFNVLDTGGSFQTVPDLVGHYKEHDIQTGKGVFKLGKPADKVPEEEWYHEIFTTDEQIKLLQSNRKQPGYFLIAPGNTNPNDYILTVYSLGQMRRFAIRAERCGFMFLDTDMFFHSLHELVDYYSTRDIKEGNRVWGKLTKPFRKEPSEKWYFGKFDREEEKKLLSVEGNGAGAFLIRVGLSDPDDYTLAVNVDGNLNHFKILSEENGFKVRDCTDCFHTLEELVDHYSDNEITVGKKSYGKLKTPFKRKEKEFSSTQTNAAAILNSPAGQRPELDIYD